MPVTVWVVAILSLSLPAEYRIADSTSERLALPGPPGLYATQEFRAWNAPGKSLYLFYWVPRAPRDLGPMTAVGEWPAHVAGHETRIIETSMFMGRQQRVLVAHLQFGPPESSAMIYARGLDRREFASILAGIKRRDAP